MEKEGRDSGDALVKAAMGYIESHSADKFSLRALSEALYINGSYLLRLFKSHTGQTLLGYHNRVRCEKAQALLRDTELSISEVGEAVGFVSSAHFSHVFKKTTGMTPTEFRSGLNAKKGIPKALDCRGPSLRKALPTRFRDDRGF